MRRSDDMNNEQREQILKAFKVLSIIGFVGGVLLVVLGEMFLLPRENVGRDIIKIYSVILMLIGLMSLTTCMILRKLYTLENRIELLEFTKEYYERR